MIKKLSVYTSLSLLTYSSLTCAAEMNSSFVTDMSKTGLFARLGESYNPIKFDQYLKASGVSNIYSRSTLVAFGASGGPANPYHASQSTFSPETQMGYFKHFTSSDKLWGVKFLSNYLGIISTDKDLNALQVGSSTNTAGALSNASFAGNVTQTSINHELALLAFVGHSFAKSHVYLGAGPSLFGTQSHLYDVTGYADNSGHFGITSTPNNLSNSKWMWGGAAQMGMTYYFNPTWVLDLSYTYAVTGLYSAINNMSLFNSAPGKYSNANSLYINNSQRVTAQAVTVSVNKVFSLF